MSTNDKTNPKLDKKNNDEAPTDVSAAEAEAVAGGQMQPGIVPPMNDTSTGARPVYTTPGPMAPRPTE